MKTRQELQALHGEQYVKDFVAGQNPFRLDRLMALVALPPDSVAADFACGSGMLMPLIAPRVKSYTGVDFSPSFIEAAEQYRKRHGFYNAAFVCADIIEFCEKSPETFDVAFAMDFSEHVYDKQWLEILCAIRRSLKPGGRLFLHTPNGHFFLEIMKKHDFIVKQFPEHIAIRTPEENASLLKSAGLEITRLQLIPHYNILRVLHALSYIPVIGKYFKARIFIEAQRPAQ